MESKTKALDPFRKPQPTLEGYSLWAFRRLVQAKGKGPGPTATWIIDSWIEDNPDLLERKFGIKREDFLREQREQQGGAVVVKHPSVPHVSLRDADR